MNEYNIKAKKISHVLNIKYDDNNIFFIDDKLYGINNSDIQIARKNKFEFIDFIYGSLNYFDIKNKSSNSSMIINNKLLNKFTDNIQDKIRDEIQKCHSKYISIYKNCNKLSELDKANQSFMYMGNEDLYHEDPEISKKILLEQINKRKEQLEKCSKERKYDKTYEKINELNKILQNNSIENYCTNEVWGSEMLGNKCANVKSDKEIQEIISGTLLAIDNKINHLPESIINDIKKEIEFNVKGKYFLEGELLEKTFDDIRQPVFGYSKHIDKYKNCPKYFICGTMKRPLLGTSACAEYVDWSRKLNTLYTQCMLYGNFKFIRFVMPPDTFLPQKRYDRGKEISDLNIFKRIPVAVMITPFIDDRNGKLENKNRKFVHYIFYDMASDITYKTMYETGSLPGLTRLKLYDGLKREIIIGQMWNYTLTTYNELNIFLKYNKNIIKKVYRSKKYPYILFFTKIDNITNDEINKMDLELINFRYDKILDPWFEYWIIDNVDKNDIINIYKNAINNKKIFAYKKIIGTNYIIIDKMINDDKIYSKMGVETIKPCDIKFFQTGGNSNLSLPIKIGLKNKTEDKTLNYFDLELIDSHIFKTFIKLNISSQSLKDDFDKNYYYLSRYYDPHMLVDHVNLSSRRTITKFKFTYDRHYRITSNEIDQLFDLKKNNKYITIYRPLTDKFFNRYELYYNFDLVKSGDNVIIFGNSSLSDIEAIDYYKLENGLNNISMTVISHPNINLSNDIDLKIKHLRDFIKFEYIVNSELFDKITHFQDADLIVDDYTIRPIKSQAYDEYYHIRLKMAISLLALKNLKKGGSFVLFIMNILLKTHADLIIILREYFEIYHLYNYEIQAKYKLIHCVVIFKNFKGISDSEFNKLQKLYKELIPYSPNILNKNEDIVPLDTFIYSYLDINIQDKIYDDFRDFNTMIFYDKVNFLQKCYKNANNGKQEQSLEIINNVIYTSFAYVKKYNFDLIDVVRFDSNNNFIIDLFEDMFIKTESLNFKFITDHNFIKKNNPLLETYRIATKENQSMIDNLLFQDRNRINVTDRVIDTRNIIEWTESKTYVRYYRPNIKLNEDLRKIVMIKYNTGNISQAWLKMYEILSTVPLINKSKTELKTFHICEAPGSFISAINHYIQTETQIKKFEWVANSLKPDKTTECSGPSGKSNRPKSKTAFGDDYGYMKKYPNNWDFGADGTGNIMHRSNMDYYKNKIKSIDLLTSDCGIPNDRESVNQHSLLKLHLSEMTLILYILPIKANFVAKFSFPIYRQVEIELLYTLYLSFDQLIFYKPKINIFSREFYVIGLGYNNVDSNILKKLFELVENFDSETKLYSNIPKSFMYQLSIIHHKMCDNYIFNFKKQVYYVDNRNELGDDFVNYMKSIITIKNKEWCIDTKIKEIDTEKRL